MLKAAQAFLAAQSVPAESLAGIGVSATGQIDSRKGIVAGTCGNLPNYIGAPIKAELEKTFGLPVTVANDANCMTLGEVWVGAAQGCTDVIGVTLGTGVGGGVLRDVCSAERPYIFTKHVYACASLAGAAVCLLLWPLGAGAAMMTGCGVTLALRICAAAFRWSLPKA